MKQPIYASDERDCPAEINQGRKTAIVSLGPFPGNRVEVEVDGFDKKGMPYNICKRCGHKIWSGLYYEVGCSLCMCKNEELG